MLHRDRLSPENVLAAHHFFQGEFSRLSSYSIYAPFTFQGKSVTYLTTPKHYTIPGIIVSTGRVLGRSVGLSANGFIVAYMSFIPAIISYMAFISYTAFTIRAIRAVMRKIGPDTPSYKTSSNFEHPGRFARTNLLIFFSARFSQGLTAASATLSTRSELLGEISEHGDDGDEEAIADGGELSTDGERRKAAHPQSQQLRENAAIRDDDATVAKPIVETNPPLAQKEGVPAVPGAGRQAWAEALGTPLEYVDYSTVAQKRVSDARRRRGSDLHRGPACPVCGG